MADTWITKMSHFDYSDVEADELPKEATRLAEYLGSILRETLHKLPGMPSSTGLQCRRRPGHIRCSGYIQSELSANGMEIRWWCSQCGDNGYISDWEGTRWDPGETTVMPGNPSVMITKTADTVVPLKEAEVPDQYEIIEGRIDYDRETDGKYPKISSATREYTWEELGRQLMTYEGFRIRISVHDDSE